MSVLLQSISPVKVYPRACGETPENRRLLQHRITMGSIPAHAGKPLQRPPSNEPPRWGLSPRMRGNLSLTARGLTSRCLEGLSPRMRGNRCQWRLAVQGSILRHAGLSPRMRGNPAHAPDRCASRAERSGSIPAHAGKPAIELPRRPLPRRVYPRACGETAVVPIARDRAVRGGLSPRMRGNPRRKCRSARTSFDGRGSIPAHAGKPNPAHHRPANRAVWVYPRACGETRSCFRRAGTDGYCWVYPRACGETRTGPSIGA